MKKHWSIKYLLFLIIPLLLSIAMSSCDSCNPTDTATNYEENVVYQSNDTASLYNNTAVDYNSPNYEVMYIRVPNDPDTGIFIRKVKDSGTHHRRAIQGRVLRGTFVIDSPNYRTTFVYAVYEPDSGCDRTRWFSFVNPSIEVSTYGGRYRKMTYKGKVKASTGLPFNFDKWNKDYQKKWVDTTNKRRKSNGERLLRKVSPNDSMKDAYPYMPLPTPEGTGFLDAPIFSKRLPGRNITTKAEQIFAQFRGIKKCVVNNRRAPSADSGMVKITTRGRTYLYCVDRVAPECLGYFSWTTVETDTMRVKWVKATGRDCDGIQLGQTGTRWAPRFYFTGATTITVGPWMSCD
ncbi:MAG: hypothetical protein R2800_04115 [Flavipsychrobacter sp.]